MDFLFFPFIGFVVGVIVGISGMGGGALMTPMLIISGIPIQVAVATDLIFAAVTKSFNITLRKKIIIINKKILVCMISGSLIGMVITSQFLKKHLEFENVDFIIAFTLACVLTITTLSLIAFTWISKSQTTDTSDNKDIYTSISMVKLVITFLVAIIIGCSVFLTSVGSGVLGIVVLLWLYPKLPIRHVVSIDICYAIPLTFFSWLSLSFLSGQESDYTLLVQLLIGSTIGTMVSFLLLKKLNERVIRSVIIVLLSITTIKLFHKSFS